ncbi:MAG: hypothetical protein J0M33_24605 [Anaerolineae bacterium]|nr:hypothetical protein [Anaerolineae bacterium]
MTNFPIIDLYSQRHAIAAIAKQLNRSDILIWMRQYGTVTEPRTDLAEGIHLFESCSGIKAAFHFSDQGLVVLNPGWYT